VQDDFSQRESLNSRKLH